MRKRQHILHFLIAISMLIVIVPLIPHHHHSNGIICMASHTEQAACACEQHHQHPSHHEHDDPCCTTDCITSFESSVPAEQLSKVQVQYLPITLFTEPLLRLLTLPEEKGVQRDYVYVEHLHGTCIACAAGLRAPPYTLS